MTALKKVRPPPAIVTINGRNVISTGQFNLPLVAEKLITDGVNEWVSISELAKFVYGKAFLANNKRVRSCIWALRRELITRGYFLIADGRPVEHIKIHVKGVTDEDQLADKTLATMRKRRLITVEMFEIAEKIVHGEPGEETT